MKKNNDLKHLRKMLREATTMVEAAEQLVSAAAEADGGNEVCSAESVLGLALSRMDQAEESAKRLQGGGQDAPAKAKGKQKASAAS